ncbi:MAG: tRNA glutamyl-Q(34) synthetase GluQRS [Sphingomonas bacterium]|nr:tRNA glutamyl-Q(34) synthetase GluQRS [Sphingomonas bacterium]
MGSVIISRFAPSPSGRLHLGHAFSAMVGRNAGEQFRLRIEDLDAGRCRAEYVAGIYQDLRWLGIAWDGEPLVQSARTAAYADALGQLHSLGLVYPCFCTRADIAAASSAPHQATAHYPGTCRGLADDPARRESTPHSWRLDAARAVALVGVPGWSEGDATYSAGDIDDVILARKDAPAAYHLACVVDDSASGVTLVVRGVDLRPSTPVQRLLQMLLGLPEPAYLHHPLVAHEVAHQEGRRLAKRDLAPTLAAMRDSGVDGAALAADLADGRLPLGFRLIKA